MKLLLLNMGMYENVTMKSSLWSDTVINCLAPTKEWHGSGHHPHLHPIPTKISMSHPHQLWPHPHPIPIKVVIKKIADGKMYAVRY